MTWREPDGTHERERVIDLTSGGLPGPSPVPGAQWDELHLCWEVWDEAAQGWMIVGDDSGRRILPLDEVPLPPPLLARELIHADEIDPLENHVIDIDRMAAPTQSVPGAQWNEVVGRWERWDEAAGSWVEARADRPADHATP